MAYYNIAKAEQKKGDFEKVFENFEKSIETLKKYNFDEKHELLIKFRNELKEFTTVVKNRCFF